ncbi:MAG: MaoC/PaaZ C-terminal domain-containing protein [Azospirillaceae bacterium]|nr:MaoC/PaaZ C-terminal domain-containing protein [Azospirillaceae bacterium]
MPLNIDYLRALEFPAIETAITDRDVMLYALTIGLGRDPLDAHDLTYVYERDLAVFPTMPLIVGHPGNWMVDQRTGITRAMVVHGGQRLRTLAPLPIGGTVVSRNRIVDILDKGASGAVLVIERETRDRATDALLAHSQSLVFCRADGGFGGTPGQGQYDFMAVPQRPPDQVVDLPTDANAALLYRLNQDRNPLHADPEVAAKAGFQRPILHGLCTYGLAAVAVAKANPGRTLATVETRFSKPVLPGETITVEMWKEADGIAFQARVAARDVVVLDRGRVTFTDKEAS